jgi:hypothetical protein
MALDEGDTTLRHFFNQSNPTLYYFMQQVLTASQMLRLKSQPHGWLFDY